MINSATFIASEICEYYLLLGNPDNGSETFLRIGCLINGVVLFISMKYMVFKVSDRMIVRKILLKLGKMTFGIYLMHILLLWKIPILLSLWNRIERASRCGIYLVTLLVFVMACLLTSLLKKIPIVKGLV